MRGLIDRFRARGLDAIACDGRAHGESTGDACTYGFYEKQDLHRVIDALAPGPIVLLGHSLGAAVALQEAAGDSRIATVVAAETFSDLRTVATERAPLFFTTGAIQRRLALAEWLAGFNVDDVSPSASSWRRASQRIAARRRLARHRTIDRRLCERRRRMSNLARSSCLTRFQKRPRRTS